MDLEFINMFFGETSKKLCLVPWLVLLKFPVSHTPPRKSTYTGTVLILGRGSFRTGTVRYRYRKALVGRVLGHLVFISCFRIGILKKSRGGGVKDVFFEIKEY